jgi:hypothetical protein
MALNIKRTPVGKTSVVEGKDNPPTTPSPGTSAGPFAHEGDDVVTFKPSKLAAPSPTGQKLIKAPVSTPEEEAEYEQARAGKQHNVRSQKRGKNGKGPQTKDLPREAIEDYLKDTDTPLVEFESKEPAPGNKRYRASKEAVEYRRKQILRLVIRGVPKQTIADHLGMGIKQVYEDMAEINKGMRDDLTNFDYQGYIGYSLAFYEECRNVALRLATDKGVAHSTQMQALQTALKAEDGKHEFLTKVGLFKVTNPTDPFAAINTGRQGNFSDQNDAANLLQSIANAAQSYHPQRADIETVEVREKK